MRSLQSIKVRPAHICISIIMLAFFSSISYAQSIENWYVCPADVTTVIFAENTNVISNPHSSLCGDSWVAGEVVPDPEYNANPHGYPFTSIEAIKVSTPEGTRPQMTLHWKPDWRGTVQVAIFLKFKYADDPLDAVNGCDEAKIKLITYKVTRELVNPGGVLTAPPDVTSKDGNADISLTYTQGSTRYTGEIARMQLFANDNFIEEVAATTITYHAPAFGNYTLKVKLIDECEQLHEGPSTTVVVHPTCYQNPPNGAKIFITGPGITTHEEWLELKKEVPYTIVSEGISDFDYHYELKHDGAQEILLVGNTFQLLQSIGSYRVEAVRRSGRSECPTVEPVDVFIGGRDEMIPKDGSPCPIVLPDDFGKFGFPNIDLGNIVLEHFAAIVKSQRSVTIKQGITLTMGAELILDLLPPEPEPLDPDLKKNFIQTTAYDEYGRMMVDGRSYFDNMGRGLQSQSKNLSGEVVLATETIYDAYGRAVISTLPAPVSVSTKQTVINGCSEEEQIGKDLAFKFKPDFVTAGDGARYDHTHFDGLKEETPDAVSNSQPGTLGWYYSVNNGTIGSEDVLSKMNEPLAAATAYPYSRSLFHRDGSGAPKSMTKPGDAFRAGGQHIASSENQKIDPADAYLEKYLTMREKELGYAKPATALREQQFFRTVTKDEHARETVIYTDKSGQSIITLYFGKQVSPIITSYNFYDNAGRLIVSVSPNGVEKYNGNNFGNIDKTTYRYNHKGWLLSLNEPDAGITNYLYGKDGRIRFSQNSEQAASGKFSYTNYDRSGRTVESGEYEGPKAFGTDLNSLLENTGYEGGLVDGTRSFWVQTYYDLPSAEVALDRNDPSLKIPVERTQRFLQGAISCTRNENMTSWYSYDDQGRVEWIVQQVDLAPEAFKIKTLDYRYGVTGSVEEVVFQKGKPDQFTHFYQYDKDGRLSKVFTTQQQLEYTKQGELSNPETLHLQATYYYYLHGPLKRVELADKLQGIDYAYTADGKLKAINHHEPAKDPSRDGTANDFKPDAFGMTLDYYPQDYTAKGYDETALDLDGYGMYNGIVSAMRWHGPVEPGTPHAYVFTYDERYQLQKAGWANVNGTQVTPLPAYQEMVGLYDKNGNIQTLERKDKAGAPIADFDYHYEANKNRLNSISEADEVRSYGYDNTGRMIYERKNKTDETYITYDVAGKVTGIYKDNNHTLAIVKYGYDDRGFRLYKTKYADNGTAKAKTTWYARDISGNVMAIYDENNADSKAPVATEMPVYGSGRIGAFKPVYGQTFYELTDHLGNVRAVLAGATQTTMLATLEQERSNKENKDFFGMRSTVTATDINHTAKSVTVEGETDRVAANRVIRLNNRPNGKYQPDPIGGGTMLWVHPGDTVRAEVYAKYARPKRAGGKQWLPLAAMKALSPAIHATELNKAFQILGQEQFRALPVWGKLDDAQPPAFLNGLMFDKDMKLTEFDFDQVSEKAMIKAEKVKTPHEKLELEFVARKEGYLYIYVSNESREDLDVYFDDLSVTHVFGDIVAGGDYYPFGLEIADRQITLEEYRFRYQGQFSEKDTETGWNHFELREYDAIIGRWLVPDPMGQHFSPYLSMGNNPMNRVDPDGGFDWYTDTNGDLIYDPNVKSQADVDLRGGGNYIGESFSDGRNAYLPGGGFLNLETGAFTETSFVRSFTEPMYGRSVISGYNYQKAIETLNARAKAEPQAECAKYVRIALEAGGLSTDGRPNYAKDYNKYLPTLGFKEVPVKPDYQPMAGDIVVMQNIGTHIYGHIQMYNGEKWVSDYNQNGFWPYTTSRPTFQIFR